MTEREQELQAVLESVLTDARYALGQLRGANSRRWSQHPTLLADTVKRALDALERVECNAAAALTPDGGGYQGMSQEQREDAGCGA